MFVGLIPHRRNVSIRQFTGDLSSLFVRNRITPGSVYAFANFESRFALSESFRNQLFMLCTAISHMSEVDLTGEQLLDLVTCALNSSEPSGNSAALPEWVRAEFRDGYNAWNARDLSNVDEWQTRPLPAHLRPVAFFQPEGVEPGGSDGGTPEESTFQAPCVGVAPERETILNAAVEQATSVEIDDQAFLARHAYLMPDRRIVPASRALQITPSSLIALERGVRAGASAAATVALSPRFVQAAEIDIAALPFRRTPGLPGDERSASTNQRAGRSQVSLAMAIRGFAASGILVILAGGLAGIVLYPYAVATYFNQSSSPGARSQQSADATQVAGSPGPLANAPANGTKRFSNSFSRRADKLRQTDRSTTAR